MKTIHALAVAAAILTGGTVHAEQAAKPAAVDGPADPARMDELIQAYVNSHQFMGAVLVTKHGQVVLDKAYGYADVEWQVPNTTDTKFRIGSMTKQFTAASILLLQERGKLKISDPIRTYLPDAPASWDKITINNLLTHTSGLPNYTSQPGFEAMMRQPSKPADIIGLFRDKPLDFAPDSKFVYSNSNYYLLGLIIEKVSGQSYSDFIQANLLTPLGLKDTGYDSSIDILPRRAHGYALGSKGLQNAFYVDMSTPYAAGALYSTTHDLLTWEKALFGGKVLSAASLKAMTTPYKDGYGYGLSMHPEDGRTAIEHNGAINGFNSDMAWFPDDDVNIIVLDNIAGPTAGVLQGKLLQLVHGETVVLPAEHKEVHVSHDVLQSYVGTYELTPNFSITFTLEGDQLMTQATGQGKFPVYAESETLFFAKVVDAEVEFVKDANGKVTGIILHQNGNNIKGVRK